MDQFATGLVGTRSPYGKPSCTFSKDHVSGGSSSGSANVVSRGLAAFSLGTDTAGSGRVPAGLNNLVGLKPTVGAFSATGIVPACKSLDCASIFALNIQDAQLVFSIMAQYDSTYGYSRHLPEEPLKAFGKRPIFAYPSNPLWYGEEENAKIFAANLEKFKAAGVDIVPVDFSILYDLANLLYEGPWVAERYSAIRDMIEKNPKAIDPVVYGIVKKAENFSAADFFDFEYKRKDLLKKIEAKYSSYDGLIVPTSPLNPSFAEIAAEPVLVNSRQGTYTNFVNLSDMSALAIPGGFRKDGLPVGITLLSAAFNDYALLELAQRYLTTNFPERTVGHKLEGVKNGDILHKGIPDVHDTIPLAVVGAHLSGQALNWQLQKVDATFAYRTKTAPEYRLYALPTVPPKPGLRKVEKDGHAIELEIWDVPISKFGVFISMIPFPLGIGNVQLENGKFVKGFICEEAGYTQDGVTDISKYGGWRYYMQTKSDVKPFNTVLVANRGEIAVRIIKTLKKLGIKAIAVYSEPDRFAQHVLDADDAVDLNGVSAAETYLSISKILRAAKKTGAQAIIPGYGFLSENADFADACAEEGVVFVGPSGDAIRALGLKHSAREIAEKASVPLVPGTGLIDSVEEAVKFAEKLEYPLMIKSTAGGGGIGLQKVDNEAELRKAFVTVQHQGLAYFNDSGVFMERFVENARHVEIQVFGDGYGKAIALGERDCSLQRRNQKIVEETPAPNFPQATRAKMRTAGEQLVRTMKYKCAGTIEFIYDEKRDEFYFLEVNARLQVEHPITEMCTGLDLVELMLLVAADKPPKGFFEQTITPKGASMEVRLYAENPIKDFIPSPGQLSEVSFPSDARVDTWISKGTKVSAEYDPTLAKIIVYGKDREEALFKLNKALDETVVNGVITNLDYLRAICRSEMFAKAKVATKVLDTFSYHPKAIEITAPGSYTTVQDYPGRRELWHIGVPPSGPMDAFAFQVANRIVGNHQSAPAIENTLIGPTILFHHDAVVAITGGTSPVTLDGEPVNMWAPVEVRAGQKLAIGKLTSGCRSYVAIRGGVDVPEYLGSRSTFALGNMGGYNGRTLKFGDVLFLADSSIESCTIPAPVSEPEVFPSSLIPEYGQTWEIKCTAGPHGSPDFFKESSLKTFFSSEWKIHYNSNRFGVRLIGPKPEWARADGGEAGLHPSNAHDYVYSLGAVNFTGDEPVILTCDGPSLGGFVCAAVVLDSEMWKVGQVKPGDKVKFVPVSYDDAIEFKKSQNKIIDDFAGKESAVTVIDTTESVPSPILYSHALTDKLPKVVLRQAGDRYILVEYGENVLDLNMSYRVYRLTSKVMGKVDGVVEMSAGVRSVLIEFDGLKITQQELVKKLVSIEESMALDSRWQVPSRILKLPMAFEDKKTLAAVDRYKETIRSSAPWLPNNVDFIKDVNHLEDRNDVRDILYQAKFLVLGLGDVFLGAPCAVPLDPRHRLLGTKYNPSRTFTPNGTVGIGGMFMCIYTMESPGGYQLVGRTIPIWDKFVLNTHSNGRPWLLSVFDQVEFYPVTEAELDRLTEKVEHGSYVMETEDSVFNFGEYMDWCEAHKESIEAHLKQQSEGNEEFAKLIQVSNAELMASQQKKPPAEEEEFSEDAILVYSEVAGRFWKACLNVGDNVSKGQGVVILEAMKTEMVINAPEGGKVVKIVHENGEMVESGDLVAVIEP